MQKRIDRVDVGEIVDFKEYSLRVERVLRDGNFVYLEGRKSTDGCPYVRKGFLYTIEVNIRT